MSRLLKVWTALIIVTVIAACAGDEERNTSQQEQPSAPAQAQEQRTAESKAQQVDRAGLADEEAKREQVQEQSSPLPNRPPIADAGADRTVGLIPSSIDLSAGGSIDPDGDRLSYQWTQIGGEQVELLHSSTASPVASFTKPRTEQTLVFELTVTDPSRDSDRDTVSVVVKNNPPIASAGAKQEVGRGESVLLNGRESSDDDGHQLTYRWRQVSGDPVVLSDPSDPRPTLTAPDALGELEFSLTVSDGFADSEQSRVTVSVVNVPPVVVISALDLSSRGARVTLDASASSDPEGGALTFKWTQTGGADVSFDDPTSATPTFVAPQRSGSLRFRLEVTDEEGGLRTESVEISISNDPPIAEAGSVQTVNAGERVRLDGSASSDPDGERLSYAWRQTAGEQVELSNIEAAEPRFTAPNRAGTLRFALTVNDGDKSDTDVATVNVEYRPVVASNQDSYNQWTPVYYHADEDAFTNEVRTDVRMRGASGALLLDVVCFDNGSAAIGFRLLGFVRPERDADVPEQLDVIWRLDEGIVSRESLDVTFLGETPALYFQNAGGGFEPDWPQVLKGGRLAVRIEYRGVQEEVFDLNTLARTPVHLNLVNCGDY